MEMALSHQRSWTRGEEALRAGMSEKYVHKKLIKIHLQNNFPRSRVGNVNNKELIVSQDN